MSKADYDALNETAYLLRVPANTRPLLESLAQASFEDRQEHELPADPIARESTRLYCAAVDGAQTSLDPKELREWMPNYGYGAHAFGLPSFQALFDNREKVLKFLSEAGYNAKKAGG